jgi:hypothetical protein
MRKACHLLLAILSLLLGFAAFGCNGGSSAVTVTLEPSGTQTINEGQTLTITATVVNDPSNKGVTWSLSGAGSLSSQTTNSVVYLAPAAVSSATAVAVTATAVADTRATARLAITVNPTPALTISTTSLPNGTVGVPYSATLGALGGVSPYSWSISSGSLPSWASMDAHSGLISGTPDATGTSIFTVKVTDSAASPDSATQALSIAVAGADSTNNATLNGQYAFLLRGFDDVTGDQFSIVGSLKADGNGNITKGLEDINGPSGYNPVVTFAGTYIVGADSRGTMTVKNSLGTSNTFAIAVGSLNSSDIATRASLIEFDDEDGKTGQRGSGFVYLQDPTTFNLASITGPYAFQFAGQTGETGTRLALTGAYSADGNGGVTNGVGDTNENGDIQSEAFTATITTDGKTALFGRVSMNPTGIPLNYVYYIVSANRALAISTNNESTAGLLSGEILSQASTAFSAASLNAPSVGYEVGSLSVNTGRWTFDGSASASYSLVWCDTSYIYPYPRKGTLSYSVAANGRVTTSGASAAVGVPGAPILYLVDNNKGFLMSTDSSVSTGFLEPQSGGPFSNASLSGNYFFGTVPPGVTESGVASGMGMSSGDGTLNLTVDESEPIYWHLSSGRSAALEVNINTDGSGPEQVPILAARGFVYMVSPKKFVVMLNGPAMAMITIFQQ